MSSLFSRRPWLPLTFILILATVLRLINIGGRALWYDEAFAVLFAEKGLSAMLYGTLTPVAGGAADIHPLLYYSLLNIWMNIVGQSPTAVRLLSVIFGVATIGFIYLLANELFDRKTALFAALITAIAPFHVQYSQETRMYTLLGLLLTSATWCFVKGWRGQSEGSFGQRWGYWIAFGVLSGLAMYTQQLAAFYLIALGLVPFLARRRNAILGVVVGGGVAVIVYSPWLVNLPGQLAKVQSYYWLEPPTIATPLLTIRSFLVVNMDLPSSASMIAFFGGLFIVVMLVVQTLMFMRQPRTRTRRKPILLVLWLAGVPVLLMWLVSQVQPVYLERSLLPSALMLYVALAWLLTRSGMPKAIGVVIGAAGLVLIGIGLRYHYTYANFPYSPFQQAGQFIAGQWQEGDVIVHQNKLTALPGIYYQRDLPQYFIGDKPGSSDDTLALPTQQALNIFADECVQAASREGKRIWWVVFARAEAEYAAADRPELKEALNWLNEHYTASSTTTYNDLNIVLYDNPRGELDSGCGT